MTWQKLNAMMTAFDANCMQYACHSGTFSQSRASRKLLCQNFIDHYIEIMLDAFQDTFQDSRNSSGISCFG